MKKVFLIILALSCFCEQSTAQFDLLYTNAGIVDGIYNPAMVGRVYGVSGVVGFSTYSLSNTDMPTRRFVNLNYHLRNDRIAFGGNFVKDKVFVQERSSLRGMASYRMYVGKGVMLMGLGASWIHHEVNSEDIQAFSINDLNLIQNNASNGMLNFSTGFYYGTEELQLQIALRNLGPIEPAFLMSSNENREPSIGVYMRGVWTKSLNEKVGFSVEMQSINASNRWVVEQGVTVTYDDKCGMGVHFRSNDAFVFSSHYKLSKEKQRSLTIGYGLVRNFRLVGFTTIHQLTLKVRLPQEPKLSHVSSRPAHVSPINFGR